MSSDSPQMAFIDRAQQELGQQSAEAQKGPRVPFVTNLVLTREQEDKMLDHATTRMRGIENEMGRDQTLQPTWWANLQPTPNQAAAAQGFLQASTFLGKRSRFDATFENDVSWRPWTMGVDNIFMSSNLVVPLSRRITRQMIAKAKGYFTEAENWFNVDPTPGTLTQVDDAIAERVQRFARFKLKETHSKENYGEAIKRALVLGECPVKVSYVVRDQIFNTEATVLADVQGTNLLGADGQHITPDDQFDEANDEMGNPIRVLSRDKTTRLPESPIWQKIQVPKRQVLFEGAKCEPIYYKDFLCPLTAKDVQTADLIAHLYDKNVMEFVDLVVKRGMVDDTTEGRISTAQKITALVANLDENSAQPKAASTQAIRPNENFTPVPSSPAAEAGPVAEFAEVYMWYDANGDGILENIMLIMDKKHNVPIYYDHVANVTTDGLRPIEVVRINPVADRWYGVGIVELFESYQIVTDLLVNRWNFSQSRSGRVDFWDPNATLEGDRDPNLKMNWGGTYTKKPGKKAEDALETVYLTDTKFEAIHEMMQFFMQLAMNESGVTNANDGRTAGLDSSELATGILEVSRSGQELFAPVMQDLHGPLERLLNREIDVTLANMNPVEVFTYLDGDTMKIDQMKPDDVRGLKYKCSITLSSYRSQQQLQMTAQAVQIVKEFYAQSPDLQARTAPMYRNMLRLLDPSVNVEQVIAPQKPVVPPPALPDPIKPSVSIAAKLELLPPEVIAQILEKLDVHAQPDALKSVVKAAAAAAGDGAQPGGAAPAKKAPGKGSPAKVQPIKGIETPFAAQMGQQRNQLPGVKTRGAA